LVVSDLPEGFEIGEDKYDFVYKDERFARRVVTSSVVTKEEADRLIKQKFSMRVESMYNLEFVTKEITITFGELTPYTPVPRGVVIPPEIAALLRLPDGNSVRVIWWITS
jgi:hypothetical protein